MGFYRVLVKELLGCMRGVLTMAPVDFKGIQHIPNLGTRSTPDLSWSILESAKNIPCDYQATIRVRRLAPL